MKETGREAAGDESVIGQMSSCEIWKTENNLVH